MTSTTYDTREAKGTCQIISRTPDWTCAFSVLSALDTLEETEFLLHFLSWGCISVMHRTSTLSCSSTKAALLALLIFSFDRVHSDFFAFSQKRKEVLTCSTKLLNRTCVVVLVRLGEMPLQDWICDRSQRGGTVNWIDRLTRTMVAEVPLLKPLSRDHFADLWIDGTKARIIFKVSHSSTLVSLTWVLETFVVIQLSGIWMLSSSLWQFVLIQPLEGSSRMDLA